MPNYINNIQQRQISDTGLQAQANKAATERENKRLTLENVIAQYGGIEAAAIQAPDIYQQYMRASGIADKDIEAHYVDILNGKVAQGQALVGNQGLAAQNGYMKGYAQQPEAEASPSPSPSPEPQDGGAIPYAKFSFEADPAQKTVTGGTLPTKLPAQELSEISRSDPRAVMQSGTRERAADATQIANTLGQSGIIGQANKISAEQDAAIADQNAILNAAEMYLQDVRPNEIQDWLAKEKRSEGYIRDYDGDFAAEILFKSLGKDRVSELTKDLDKDWVGTPGGLKKVIAEGNLDANSQAAYQKIKDGWAAYVEEAKVAEANYREAKGYRDGANAQGDKVRDKMVDKQIELAVGTPEVGTATWAALGADVPAFVQKLQYYEELEKRDPDMYYSLMPQEMANDVKMAELEGKKIDNETSLMALKQMKAMMTPEYFEALGETGALKLYAELQHMAAETASLTASASPMGVDVMKLWAQATGVLNAKGSSKEAIESANNTILKIMTEMSNYFENFNMELLEGGLFSGGKLKTESTVGQAQKAVADNPDAVAAFTSPK